MNNRRIAKHLTHRGCECFQNARFDRRGRVVVKVGAHALLVLLFFAVTNAPLLAKNPADDGSTSVPPQKPAAAAETAPNPADVGTRKLSRRERKERIKTLADKYGEFLTDVEPIMQPAELDTFLLLDTDAQRDLYIEDFWHRRDLAQGTSNHTFRKEYYDRIEAVKAEFRYLSSDRARVWLLHGEPNDRVKLENCRLLQPIEIWKYVYIEGMGHDVRFLFVAPRNGIEYRLWTPLDATALTDLISQDAIGMSTRAEDGVAKVFGPVAPGSSTTNPEFQCRNGAEVLQAIAQPTINKTDIQKVFEPARVNEEDVH